MNRRFMKLLFLTICMGIAFTHAATASAAAILVETTNTAVQQDGLCSLLEAVQAVNTQAPVDDCPAGDGSYDYIMLPSGRYSISGPVTITRSVEIDGYGEAATIIDAAVFGSGLLINSASAMVQMWELSIVQENPTGRSSSVRPAIEVRHGAAELHYVTVRGFKYQGIINHDSLSMYHTTVESNGAGGIKMSAPSNAGCVTFIYNSTIRNNFGTNTGGGISNDGNGFSNLNIFSSNIAGNRATVGGGLYCNAPVGYCNVESSTFANNVADTAGGALYNGNTPFDVTDTTFSGNTAPTSPTAFYSSTPEIHCYQSAPGVGSPCCSDGQVPPHDVVCR